jgi:hypothetical protein
MDEAGGLEGRVLASEVSDIGSDSGEHEQDQPIALRAAPRAGAGDVGYLELPGRE